VQNDNRSNSNNNELNSHHSQASLLTRNENVSVDRNAAKVGAGKRNQGSPMSVYKQ